MHSTGPNSCSLTYLAQVDPKGNLCCWTCGVVMQILVTVEIWLISQECIYITRHYSVPDPLVNVNASACYQSCWILGRNRATFWHNNFWFSPQHLLGSLPKWVVNKASQYLVPQVSAAFLWCVCQVPPHRLEHRAEESGCPWEAELHWECASWLTSVWQYILSALPVRQLADSYPKPEGGE